MLTISLGINHMVFHLDIQHQPDLNKFQFYTYIVSFFSLISGFQGLQFRIWNNQLLEY